MKVYTVTTLTVLSVQLSWLVQSGGGKGLVAAEKPAGAEKVRSAPQPSGRGEKVPEGSLGRHPPAAKAQKVESRARSHSKPLSKPQQGERRRQKATSKQQNARLQPHKRKSSGSNHHLESHGKFNTDTYSCAGIQSKTCQKPSDCDGCLGLYTCKLPRGQCGLKAVSKETGTAQLPCQPAQCSPECIRGSDSMDLTHVI